MVVLNWYLSRVLSDSIQRFDLYDLFSILIPGISFLIGISPFLPSFIDLGSVELLLPVLVLGFVFGRGIHIAATQVESKFGNSSHRERFQNELQSPSLMDDKVVKRFCQESANIFDGIGLDDLEDDLVKKESLSSTLYVLVRSYIHMDSRGRSRTFQAIYSFYRSMWITSIILTGIYIGYGLLDATGSNIGVLPFQTHFGSLDVPSNITLLAAEALLLLSYQTFSNARESYQKYFIQYLIADFLVLETADYPEALVVTEDYNQSE